MLLQKLVLTRRPSGPTIIAITGSLLFILLLLSASRSGVRVKASAYFPGHDSSDILEDVFNRTLGFEKIFVINLPARTDRRDGIVLSAALSDIDLEVVDGIYGDTIVDKVIPMGPGKMTSSEKGCWRSHMNIIQEIIQRNISSALILEDDSDWDVHIKQQLHDFALSTRALTQPLLNETSYADPTYPTPMDSKSVPDDIDFHKLPLTVAPEISPYGDSWDFLWFGHCTMRFPNPGLQSSPIVPKGRVVRMSDPTVPAKKHLPNVTWGGNDISTKTFPDHTRVVHHVADGMCSTGYAITQAAARELLYWVGLTKVNDAYDALLQQFCEGGGGRKYHNCLAANPSLIRPYRAAGSVSSDSDIQLIGSLGTGSREKGMTEGLRWSTRLNLEVLLAGETKFFDSYPEN